MQSSFSTWAMPVCCLAMRGSPLTQVQMTTLFFSAQDSVSAVLEYDGMYCLRLSS